MLTKETKEPEEKNSTKVGINDPLVKASSVEVLESSPSLKKKQKSKWAMALDESSGEKYYYNRITKETTWDRPASFEGDDLDASIPVYPKVYDSVASSETTNKDPTDS
ncbi:MAG: WW domain-containing protein, partial [bacterium]